MGNGVDGDRRHLTERDSEWRALRGLPTGKLELVKTLLARRADPNARIVKQPPRFGFGGGSRLIVGATPFLLAAMAGDVPVMRVLVAGGADPQLVTKDRTTPVMVAAGLGRFRESSVTQSSALDAVALALELGGDVNAVNEAGDTALHGAASMSANAIVQLLVDRGAMVNLKNKRGQTPLAVSLGTSILAASTSTADLLRKLGGTVPRMVKSLRKANRLIPGRIANSCLRQPEVGFAWAMLSNRSHRC